MKTYAICRNGRFLSYTKEDCEIYCWLLFLCKHVELGGKIIGSPKDFIDEAKQLGFKVREYND